MADSAKHARFRIDLDDGGARKRRVPLIILVLAVIAGAPFAMRLERAFPGALDLIAALVWTAGAVATWRALGRGGTPFALIFLVLAAFSVVLAMVDAGQG